MMQDRPPLPGLACGAGSPLATLSGREVRVSSEIATSIPRDEVQQAAARRPWRALAVQLLGPVTILGGLVWAVAQPYRIVLLDRAGQGIYDYLFQAPLLVVLVGLAFTFLIAPGLVEDLEAEERRDPAP
jgi:hypothetical protein